MTQSKLDSVTIKSPNVQELVLTTLKRIESEYVLNELDFGIGASRRGRFTILSNNK